MDPTPDTFPAPTSTATIRERPDPGCRDRRVLAWAARLLLACSILICGGEGAAHLVYRDGASAARTERELFLRQLPGQATGEGSKDTTQLAVQQAFGSTYHLHPYFGYTFEHSKNSANAQGFFSGPAEFPYRRAPDEFVIGIFGGSVAMQVAAQKESLVDPLRKALAKQGYAKVTLLSFAVGGWRQPQSLFALLIYARTIDMAVLLDGFNDVVQLNPGGFAQYPADFPMRWIFEPLSVAGSMVGNENVMELQSLNRSAGRLTRAADWAPLRNSALVHLFWRFYASRYQARSAHLHEAIQYEIGSPWSKFEPTGNEAERNQRRDSYFDLYADAIRTSADAMHRLGRPFFHFVQPNQYDLGSKPLSDEERTSFLTQTWSLDPVRAGYPRLDKITNGLRADGIESEFLGRIFAKHPETLYSDACCHLNADGIRILNSVMAGRILESPEFGLVKPAGVRAGPPSRESIGDLG